MAYSLTNTNHLPTKSLFLSILIHAAILSQFIFVWPSLPQPHKPKMIFLGSILQPSDLTLPLLGASKDQGAQLKSLHYANRSNGIFSAAVEKPHDQKSYLPTQKRTIKPVYEEDAEKPKKEVEKIEGNINVEFDVAPYQPLRLKKK